MPGLRRKLAMVFARIRGIRGIRGGRGNGGGGFGNRFGFRFDYGDRRFGGGFGARNVGFGFGFDDIDDGRFGNLNDDHFVNLIGDRRFDNRFGGGFDGDGGGLNRLSRRFNFGDGFTL